MVDWPLHKWLNDRGRMTNRMTERPTSSSYTCNDMIGTNAKRCVALNVSHLIKYFYISSNSKHTDCWSKCMCNMKNDFYFCYLLKMSCMGHLGFFCRLFCGVLWGFVFVFWLLGFFWEVFLFWMQIMLCQKYSQFFKNMFNYPLSCFLKKKRIILFWSMASLWPIYLQCHCQ